MDVRLTAEQRQLREAAAKLADDLGPGSVADLDDASRDRPAGEGRRRDGISDAADRRRVRGRGGHRRRGVRAGTGRRAVPRPGARRRPGAPALGREPSALTAEPESVDLTRSVAGVVESPPELGELSEEDAGRWHALALRDHLRRPRRRRARRARPRASSTRRTASSTACRSGRSRPSAPARRAPGADRGLAQRARARGVGGRRTARRRGAGGGPVAKAYCARAALTVCETAIQVHGGIGNTWECIAHVYLRRRCCRALLGDEARLGRVTRWRS